MSLVEGSPCASSEEESDEEEEGHGWDFFPGAGLAFCGTLVPVGATGTFWGIFFCNLEVRLVAAVSSSLLPSLESEEEACFAFALPLTGLGLGVLLTC